MLRALDCALYAVPIASRRLTPTFSDLYQLDMGLDRSVGRLIDESSGLIAALVIIAWALPWFLLPCAAAIVPCIWIQRKYCPTMRAIRRLGAPRVAHRI